MRGKFGLLLSNGRGRGRGGEVERQQKSYFLFCMRISITWVTADTALSPAGTPDYIKTRYSETSLVS